MKTRIVRMWALGLAVASLPIAGGYTWQASSAELPPGGTNAASTAVTNLGTVLPTAATNAAGQVAIVPEKGEAPERAQVESRPVPPDLKVTPSLMEIIKMANSGVEEAVLLSFATNSAGIFSLGAEQIIYLNDIGVPSSVITAMIKNDQDIASGAKSGSISTVPTPSPGAGVTSFFTPQTPPATNRGTGGAPTAGTAAQYAPAYEAPAAAAAPAAPIEPPPPAQAPVATPFYADLAPYGTWVNVDGYGWCWQPTVTVIHAGWQPYFDRGRWIYTDCGWYWNSDYSWGGIAFHYGRWFSHPRWGWCWWPDHTWGPSWVTWRYTDAYCGWAPLPPYSCYTAGVGFTYYGSSVSVGFSFGLGAACYGWVPWGWFCDYHPYHYGFHGSHGHAVYQHSVVVNNFSHGDHHRVMNQGIGVHKVEGLARSEVRRGTVREFAPESNHRVQPDRVSREGREYVIHRPAPANPGAKPVAGSSRERPGSTVGRGESASGFAAGGSPQTRSRPITVAPRGGTTRPGDAPSSASSEPNVTRHTPGSQPASAGTASSAESVGSQSSKSRVVRVGPYTPSSTTAPSGNSDGTTRRNEPSRTVTRVTPGATATMPSANAPAQGAAGSRSAPNAGRPESRTAESRRAPTTVLPNSSSSRGTAPTVVMPSSSPAFALNRSENPRSTMPTSREPSVNSARPSVQMPAAAPSYSAPSRPSSTPSAPAFRAAPSMPSAPPSAPAVRSSPAPSPAPSMSRPAPAPAPSRSVEARGSSPSRSRQEQ